MKNYYFKVFVVACCAIIVTFLFRVNVFAGFFLDGEYHNEPIPMSSLLNETSWDSMQGYVSDVWGLDFPTWSQASAVDDMLEDIAMFYVGQTVSVSQNVASAVANAVLDSTSTVYDIWDMISFDGDNGDFVRNPNYSDNDLTNVIHGAVDPLIYDEGSQAGEIVAGTYWVALPANIYYGYVYNKVENMHSTVSNTYFCLVRQSSNRVVLYWSSSNSGGYVYSGEFIPSGGVMMNSTYSVNGNTYYYGGWANEFRTDWRLGSSSGQSLGIYSDINTALAALWGSGGPSSDPVLNGEGIIINENPNYKPVTGYSVLNYDYSTHIVNNYNTGEPITWPKGVNTVQPYTYDYKGIYWDSPDLDTLEYPAEIEFPSVEFETIEVDESVDNALENLNGSWIVEFFLVAILLLILGLIL